MRILSWIAVLCLTVLSGWAPPAQAGQRVQGGASQSLPWKLTVTLADGRFHVKAQNADLAGVIQALSQKAGVPVALGPGVRGRVTTDISGGTFQETLRRLTQSHALVFAHDPETRAFRIVSAGAFSGGVPDGQGFDGLDPAGPGVQPPPGVPVPGPPPGHGPETTADDPLADGRFRPEHKAGELLVRFNPGVNPGRAARLHHRLGCTEVRRLRGTDIALVRVRAAGSEAMAIAGYENSGLVRFAERHALRHTDATVPDDPLFSEQWGMGLARIDRVWDITRGDAATLIAVVDTGVSYAHPDLAANAWLNPLEFAGDGVDNDGNGYIDDVYGWDFADGDPDPTDTDPDSHGTHVAGIIAAVGDNGRGIAGVNWSARIMALKVQADGSGDIGVADVIEAVDYARVNGVRAVNCSFGGTSYSHAEYEAFDRLRQNGILAVCAAGNSGRDNDVTPYYPASHSLDNIISVAAGDPLDRLAGFSNFGRASVDVMAPGIGIVSTLSVQASVIALEGSLRVAANGMTYAGTTTDSGVTGRFYDCGTGNAAGDFPPGLSGFIALVARDGKVSFADKTVNAQNAGAAAVVIRNHLSGTFEGTLRTPGDWVPVVAVSKEDGQTLAGLAAQGPSLVTVVNKAAGSGESYGRKDGTSMAAPFVSGIAGLLLAMDPDLDAGQVKSLILTGVDPIPSVSENLVSGGRVNALRTVCRRFALAGDLDLDLNITLADAILSLNVLSGISPPFVSPCLEFGSDVDGDGRVGMAEALHTLEAVSGLR